MTQFESPRVIFVDDDPLVLRAIRRPLARMLAGWDLVFAASGADALASLARVPAHAIVTDYDMPRMDGAALLTRVRRQSPEIVRVILSGSSNHDDRTRTIGLAHQYWSKPVDSRTLARKLRRVVALAGLIDDPRLRRLVAGRNELPAAPPAHAELTALFGSDAPLAEIVEIIERDVGMAATVMHAASSDFTGKAFGAGSLHDACALVGRRALEALVLEHRVVAPFAAAVPGFSIDEVARHARATAAIAHAMLGEGPRANDAFIAGLLHNVGRIVLASREPERYARALELEGCGSPAAAEHRVFGAAHAEVGAYLLGVWGVADHHVDAIARCERPSLIRSSELDLSAAIYVATRLATSPDVEIGEAGDHDQVIDRGLVDRIGRGDAIDGWRALARRFFPG